MLAKVAIGIVVTYGEHSPLSFSRSTTEIRTSVTSDYDPRWTEIDGDLEKVPKNYSPGSWFLCSMIMLVSYLKDVTQQVSFPSFKRYSPTLTIKA